jgi:hypothetical protein
MSRKMETSIIVMLSEVVIVLTSTALTIFSARTRSMRLGIVSSQSGSDPQKSILQPYLIRLSTNAKMPTMLQMSGRRKPTTRTSMSEA